MLVLEGINMNGEQNLEKLLKTMKPKLNPGEYIFYTTGDIAGFDPSNIVMLFREEEGNTLILEKVYADSLDIAYHSTFSWITLSVHSSLEAVGLTAAFSTALAAKKISCNVVAGFYHDHIFVGPKDAEKAMEILERFSEGDKR